jgi:hypothetical protein
MLDPLVVPPQLGDVLPQLYLWKGPENLFQINDPTVISCL